MNWNTPAADSQAYLVIHTIKPFIKLNIVQSVILSMNYTCEQKYTGLEATGIILRINYTGTST